MIKGIIFDFDGTLVDSMPIWKNLGSRYLISKGLEPQLDLESVLNRMSINECSEFLIKEYQLNMTPLEVTNEINEYISNDYEKLKLKSKVLEVLNYYKSKDIKMAIATANDLINVEKFIISNNLLSYFEFIITCPELETNKKSILIFEEATKRLNLNKEEVIFVEDALHPIEVLINNGFKVYAVYDENEKDNINKIKSIATKYYQKFDDWYHDILNI